MTQATSKSARERGTVRPAQRNAKLVTALLQGADQAVAAVHPSSGRVAFANTAFADLLGTRPEELEGRSLADSFGAEATRTVLEPVPELLAGVEERVSICLDLERPLRPRLRLEAALVVLRPTPRRPLLGIYLRDVTDETLAQARIQDQRRFLQRVIDDTLQCIIVTDLRGKVLLFNRGARGLLGFEAAEVMGRKYIQDFYEGDVGREVMRMMRSEQHGGRGVLDRHQAIVISKDRERIPVWMNVHLVYDDAGNESGTVSYVHDMRGTMEMERRLEEVQMQLIHADKMASLGKLAAGVAHEINNPLGGILLFGGLLLEDMDFSDPRREDVDRIVQEARRCKEIVNSLLDFAHQKKRYHEPVDMNAAVEQCLSLLGNKALFHNITVELQLGEYVPPVTGNPSQIKQVFTNIVTNAVDAMDGEGVLTIGSRFDEKRGEVCVSFSDTGPGIPSGLATRIFDPFFTTKEPGKGTGLGLSLSYNIIHMHRGDIRVHSPPGQGTTFTIALPAQEEDSL